MKKKIDKKIKKKEKKMKGKSCWLINDQNSLQRLNLKKPTRENVRFLIECYDCIALDEKDPEIHVFELQDLIIDEEGDSWVWCPITKTPINWISQKRYPKQIKKLLIK